MSNSPFHPGIWSSEIERVYRKQSFLGGAAGSTPLDARDVWQPTGETYEDPVAWSKLLGVRVMKPAKSTAMKDQFVLLHPKSYPFAIDQCSPRELTHAIKSFATLCDGFQPEDAPGAAEGGGSVDP